jgi:hypothetical protein
MGDDCLLRKWSDAACSLIAFALACETDTDAALIDFSLHYYCY